MDVELVFREEFLNSNDLERHLRKLHFTAIAIAAIFGMSCLRKLLL